MRPNYASLAVFAGLAAMVTGDGLPPDAIPIQCATICGPVVELTALCDIHNRVRRRRIAAAELETREWAPKLANVEPRVGARAAAPFVGQTLPRPPGDDDRLARRNFTVIRPAPTSFPPELAAEATRLNLRPTEALQRLNPIIVDLLSRTRSTTSSRTMGRTQPTSIVTSEAPDDDAPPLSTPPILPSAVHPPSFVPPPPAQPTNPDLPPPALLPPPSAPAPTPSNPATTTVTLGDMSKTLSSAPMEATNGKGQKGTDNGNTHPVGNDMAEEQCVCLNTSFDVAQVAALCSSCIASTGDANNNAQIIVDTCNFTPQTYSQDKDRIVNNIRVKAERPNNAWDQGSSVDNSGSTHLQAHSLAVSLAVGTIGFLLGTAVLS